MSSGVAWLGPTTKSNTMKKRVLQRWRCDKCGDASFFTLEDCEVHESTCPGKRLSSQDVKKPENDVKQATIAAKEASEATTSVPATAVSQRPVRKKSKPAPFPHPFFTNTAEPAKKKVKSKKESSISTSKTSTKLSTTKAASKKTKPNTDENCLNAFFQGASPQELKALQAQQKVAEFQAKRRRQKELERERRLKRQKTPSATKTEAPVALLPPANPIHTQFPVPSHVISKDNALVLEPLNADSSTTWWNESQAVNAHTAWQRYYPWEVLMPVNNDGAEPAFTWNTSNAANEPLHTPCDVLLQALACMFVPSSSDTESTTIPVAMDATLSSAGLEVAAFFQEWKDIRKESERRLTERHRKLSGKKAQTQPEKSHSRKSAADEDWFLSGSDESEAEGERMASLLLLTGDHGVGKTSLVYQVAEQAGCAVLEVNTSEVRGSAALRKRIQEATQTHSAKWNKKTSIFPGLIPPNEEEPKEQSAVMTIILLDEVDLLYPANGDNGFWSALSDVSKKAKAPIVLTANRFPDELRSPVYRFQHVHVETSIEKCALFLKQKATCVGLVVRPERQVTLASDAQRIARLANGDYRRISLAIDLLKATSNSKQPVPTLDSRLRLLTPTADPPQKVFSVPIKSPRITQVYPYCVPADQMSLIRIFGIDLLSFAEPPFLGPRAGYPVKVRIGFRDCPHARILDDNTIMAVCPPLVEQGQSKTLSLEMKYAPVTVTSATATGVLWTSVGMIDRITTFDGSPWTAVRPTPWVEYRQLDASPNPNGNESSQEEEFELNDVRAPVKPAIRQTFPAVDPKAALQILAEGIQAWLSQRHLIPEIDEIDREEDEESLAIMERVYRSAALESDATFFEDCGLEGMPFLAGGSVAYEKNEESSLLQCQRSRENEMDRWIIGSNSFVTKPTPRETRLLKRVSNELRGIPHVFESAEEDDDSGDAPIFKEDPDDDALLPFSAPNALNTLSGYLRRFSDRRITPCSVDLAFASMQRDIWERKINLLETYVFAFHRADKKIFFAGLNRDLDPLLETDALVDPRLVLDYMPMIRRMAVMERAFEKDHDHIQAQNMLQQEADPRRSTRSSARMGRTHYFETAFEYLTSLHDSEHSHRVGKAFCEGFLCY